jgi:hypothetical protein
MHYSIFIFLILFLVISPSISIDIIPIPNDNKPIIVQPDRLFNPYEEIQSILDQSIVDQNHQLFLSDNWTLNMSNTTNWFYSPNIIEVA